MDMEKIRVRQDLSRMVMNYCLRGSITEDQSTRICNYIDSAIGGGNLPQPYISKKGGAVIPFPTSYTGEKEPTSDYERAEQTAKLAARSEIYAPYGEPLPEGVHDFRQSLQRDGLVLIYYEMRTSREGNFFNVLWAKSNSEQKCRNTEWSGPVREEEIPYVLPLDSEKDYNYHTSFSFVYSVGVAPDNILKGPLQEFYNYIESLKAAGFKNNFDYVFNFTAEKRNRYIEKNRELINLKLPARTLHALNERGIHTKKDLQKISIQELRKVRNLGPATVEETITALEAAGIKLQEEKENYV